jgi:hypothetical protein
VELLRTRLEEAGTSEARLIRWLKDRGAIPVGTRGFQCIDTRQLEIILEE